MTNPKPLKPVSRCAYLKSCYLAEELKCFGYKTDCALYQQSNDEEFSRERFDEAMDRLINRTKERFRQHKV